MEVVLKNFKAMGKWLSTHTYTYDAFWWIPEPRIVRIMQFGIYLCMGSAGTSVLIKPSHAYESVLGGSLVYVFGSFLVLGSLLGAIAVLPGIWWLERIGLLLLITAMGLYVIVIVTLGVSVMGIVVALAFGLTFTQRWTEIKGAQLAPREE